MINYDQLKRQTDLLFDPGETFGFKDDVDSSVELFTEPRQFLMMCPLANLDHARGDNVTAYRNFLVELDEMPLEQQPDYIERKLKMPFTTKTYSGGKSYHYVISLDKPLATRAQYSRIVAAIFAIVGGVDTSNCNPNKLCRAAGVVRPSTGKMQELIETRKRVTHAELYKWLYIDNAKITAKIHMANSKEAVRIPLAPGEVRPLSKKTRLALEEGKWEGSRHGTLSSAGVNMWKCGYDRETIEQALTDAAYLMGIGDRGDVRSLIKWIELIPQEE